MENAGCAALKSPVGRCLYGANALSIVNLAKLAAACAAQGLPSPSQQIIFGTPLPYYHSKAEDMLRVTYQEQVTVALPQRVKRSRCNWTMLPPQR